MEKIDDNTIEFNPDITQEFTLPEQVAKSRIGNAFKAVIDGKEVSIIVEVVEPGRITGRVLTKGDSESELVELPPDLFQHLK